MLEVEALAAEGLRLLGLGDSPGNSAARDAGLSLCNAALTLEPTGPHHRKLALACSSALRSRYRFTLAMSDLLTALGLVEQALAAAATSPARSHLLAERARVMVRLHDALDVVNSLGAAGSSPVDPDRPKLLDLALDSAQAALSSTDLPEDEQADFHHAAGVAHWGLGQTDDAIVAFRRALDSSDASEYRFDLARALTSRYDESANADDASAACRLLEEIADEQMMDRPREAFNAARFHGYWATSRGRWREAAQAYGRALAAREQARGVESQDQRQLQWLYATGAVAAESALAWIRVGDPVAAVMAIENSNALELVERMQAAQIEPQNLLDSDECLVYTTITTEGAAAILVGSEFSSPITVDLPGMRGRESHDRILDYARKYRTWQNTNSPAARRAWMQCLESMLQWLGDSLVWPIASQIPEGISRLAFVSGSTLSLLPIHAAIIPHVDERKAFALERFDFRYAPSARTLARLEATIPNDTQNVLTVSNPASAAFAPLPHADLETAVLRSWLPDGESLQGEMATLDAVKDAMPHHSVVHFAAHAGARFDEPLLSAVMLAYDEPLTLGQILELRLESVRLVALSACESGMQDVRVPEEQFGLPFGLLQAGAQGVLGSLWAVSDASTMVLMLRFYWEWLRNGATPRDALMRAQRWMVGASGQLIAEWVQQFADELPGIESTEQLALREFTNHLYAAPQTKPYEHPYHWAGFAYFGA